MIRRHWGVMFSASAGAFIGFVFLHPYTMVVYGLYGAHGDAGAMSLLGHAAAAFQPRMIAMGSPFAMLGAGVGFFYGAWLQARNQRLECETRFVAAETLKQLMVTLAHHLLNAAQVVGGFATLCLKTEQDNSVRKHLETIRQEAKRIEAVVQALQSVEVVTAQSYADGSAATMIDIREELERRLSVSSRPMAGEAEGLP